MQRTALSRTAVHRQAEYMASVITMPTTTSTSRTTMRAAIVGDAADPSGSGAAEYQALAPLPAVDRSNNAEGYHSAPALSGPVG